MRTEPSANVDDGAKAPSRLRRWIIGATLLGLAVGSVGVYWVFRCRAVAAEGAAADFQALISAGGSKLEFVHTDPELKSVGITWTRKLHHIYDADPDRLGPDRMQRLAHGASAIGLNLSARPISHSLTLPSNLGGLRLEGARGADALVTRSASPLLTYLLLSGSDIGDQGFAALPRCIQLTYLDISRTGFADRHVGFLGSRILYLDLSDTGLTDVGLRALARLGKRNALFLENTRITSDGLAAYLNAGGGAGYLSVARCDIGDELAETIGRSQQMVLFLGDTRITGEGLRKLWQAGMFAELHLNGCRIGNADLEALTEPRARGMTFTTLNLAGTEVDDGAIPTLLQLRHLQRLLVDRDRFSLEGMERLEKSLPALRIELVDDPHQKFSSIDPL